MATKSSEPRPIAVQRIAYVPLGLVVAIVVLRLVTGWHFYREGTKKLAYNPETGVTTVAFSAEPFLRQAVGPVSDMIKDDLPNVYNWERYLAVPRQARPSTEEELEKRAKWETDYAARRKAAASKKETAPVEFPPHSPYYDWADRIDAGWRKAHDKFIAIAGLTEEQKSAATAALSARREQLADYLASQTEAIAEWEHDLYRLEQMKADTGSVDLPFLGTRIQEKTAETTAASSAWIAQVRDIEAGYKTDLRYLLTAEQEANAAVAEQVNLALVDANAQKLHRMNLLVTAVIIGTGVCLMLGLFTRLASIAGALFLLSVIATQPPWVTGANTTVFYYQLVEIAGLGVLFAAAAGRWAGLDYFIRLLTSKCCGRKESSPS